MNSSKQLYSLFLAGDVMTGRGIDQILAHPSQRQLYEAYVKDARVYLRLAEKLNGHIPRPKPGAYLWGDALKELKRRQPKLRLINLETSISCQAGPWPEKDINYRMHPENIDALTAAGIDVCALANNHILDWGRAGCQETLAGLDQAKIKHAGAGQNREVAAQPAICSLPELKRRVLVFSLGCVSSGIPAEWAAKSQQTGLWLAKDFSSKTIKEIETRINSHRQTEDLCILSIHWGANWGYRIPLEHQVFAHRLIDEVGLNLIHGHSSHHPLGIELYQRCPIFYGCGDLINDYEGISGWEEFRADLGLMYFVSFDAHLRLAQLDLVPVQRKGFQLHYAKPLDCQWLIHSLEACSRNFTSSFDLDERVIHCC